MNNCIARPTSRSEIRRIVKLFKKKLGLTECICVPIVELLDILTTICDFNYEIVPDNHFPKQIYATTDVKTKKIKIKEFIYNRATRGDGFARFTIAHEIGHYIMLCFLGFSFTANISNEPIPAYQNPEWQANCFAGEFLMPYDLVKDYSIDMLIEKCNVTKSAAQCQYNAFRKQRG